MPRFQIFRGYPNFDMMHIQHMKDVIKRSRELLSKTPAPDTFAGRKTQEPFAVEDEEHTARWMGSKELQPPE